jgi:hypothetical protein
MRAILILLALTASASAQQTLTVGIYAPSTAFADSTARLNYVQAVAKSIQAKTNVPTSGKAYVRLADLLGAKPDFAIIDGQCLAARSPGAILATAVSGGETAQVWGLYAASATTLPQLKGKKLAYVKTGCRDTDFLDNAMLDSEEKSAAHFTQLIDKPDAAGAVAAVRDYKNADAVFAPGAQARGLVRVYDAHGTVPNPGFVQVNAQISAEVTAKVKEAILAHEGGGIDGWRAPVSYATLAGRMVVRVKRPWMAAPEAVRLDDDVLIVPPAGFRRATVKQHFWEPTPQEKSQ